ncbi:MAG TPA: homocysteine S-methyltransferase family protein [Beijerinckiaceae bacterium]|nr:homocysteine S-methyltransferase family protein [Beijerinckiaceae bacterium]
MPRYRHALPQLDDALFLTDGGLETCLVFHDGVDLPCFAAFPLVLDEDGRARLRRYFRPYLETARARGIGFVLDTPTWRASPDWGARIGFSAGRVDEANRLSVDFCLALRDAFAGPRTPIVINGVVGPRGDGYTVEGRMSAAEAQAYHARQIAVFAESEADMVTAVTMTYPDEAVGVTRAARAAGLPVAISFTVETDGLLPSGETLREAVETVDRLTAAAPAYYMINCAHPTHFADALGRGEPWLHRVRGVRANASTKSHAELDAATELDSGDPVDLAGRIRGLRERLGLSVLGGCCGTDHRHIAAICEACTTGEEAFA